MSKLYTALAAAAIIAGTSLTASADLKFYVGDTPVTSGETVNFVGAEITAIGPKQMVKMAPEVLLESTVSRSNIIVKVTSLTGQAVQCCAGGQCEMNTSIEKKNVSISAGQKLNIQFEYMEMLNAGEIPDVEAKIEAQYYLDNNSKREFIIHMSATAGVEIVEVTGQPVKPCVGGLEYSLNGDATVAIYSISGKLVKKVAVSGHGIIPTTDLPGGVYIYKVTGAASLTGKFTR
ncbi:MAG: T9SS type A sorting domain-containing protein [Paramuribaculum sp.]|nr:T9SS type A sorting domain-containing protein [Paramuribaculum sp.]MDE6304700.1 T9SS type A sorting domain-containing protein [Paramuribaculum sp.]